jgi:hypothetical protein
MIIANAMNSKALALERFRAEMMSYRGYTKASLVLDTVPAQAVVSSATCSGSELNSAHQLAALAWHRLDSGPHHDHDFVGQHLIFAALIH